MAFLAFGTPVALPFARFNTASASCRRHSPPISLRRGIIRPRGNPSPEDGLDSKRSVPDSTIPPISAPGAQTEANTSSVVSSVTLSDIPAVALRKPSVLADGSETSSSEAESGESKDDVDGGEVVDDENRIPVRMTGFNTPLVFSTEIAEALLGGERVMTRAQAASHISRYARAAGLAVSGTRSFRTDATLRVLFPDAPDLIRFQTVTGLLTPHVTKPDDCGDAKLRARARAHRREYAAAAARDTTRARPDRRGRHSAKIQTRMKKLGRGLFTPVRLSTALKAICGEGEDIMSRPEVTKKVWVHIKRLNLQDASDGRLLHLDPLLSEVCGGLKDVNCFELSRYIARNLTAVQAG